MGSQAVHIYSNVASRRSNEYCLVIRTVMAVPVPGCYIFTGRWLDRTGCLYLSIRVTCPER
ncbi:hypothetical protein B0H12DRAFT_1105867 [Mycena haematopus]|nr:hypothetical protein B0H12DRAFT_1105867 [Mycena haematopus]